MKTVRIAMLGSGFVADFYMQGLANVNGQRGRRQLLALRRSARTPSRSTWSIPEHCDQTSRR